MLACLSILLDQFNFLRNILLIVRLLISQIRLSVTSLLFVLTVIDSWTNGAYVSGFRHKTYFERIFCITDQSLGFTKFWKVGRTEQRTCSKELQPRKNRHCTHFRHQLAIDVNSRLSFHTTFLNRYINGIFFVVMIQMYKLGIELLNNYYPEPIVTFSNFVRSYVTPFVSK